MRHDGFVKLNPRSSEATDGPASHRAPKQAASQLTALAETACQDDVHQGALVNKVARGGAQAFVIYSVGIALMYFSQLVVARAVGVETFGLYTYVFAWMVVLVYFSTLGFDVGVLRFIPVYKNEKAWPLLR